jgi:hypothetical protein
MAFVSKNEAWQKVNKTDITIFKKEVIFYNLFEYELKKFLNTEKNTKLLKILVSELVYNNLTLDIIKQVILNVNDKKIPNNLIKIGCVDNNYILYIDRI